MGIRPLAPSQLRELAPLGVGFERSTPLWYYVLKEAELLADGLRLGPVGARIVAEVFIGLLQTDPGSYLTRAAALATDAAPQDRVVSDDRLPHLRRRRPALARSVTCGGGAPWWACSRSQERSRSRRRARPATGRFA